jgi:hypothetical protein
MAHLSPVERRAYVLADNKLALNAGWDNEILAIELQALVGIDFDLSLTGFSLAEVDLVLDQAGESKPEEVASADVVPEPPSSSVSRHGDLWLLARHRLLCGDARNAADYRLVLGEEKADLIFTDPPYNVPIDGNVCGLESTPWESTGMRRRALKDRRPSRRNRGRCSGPPPCRRPRPCGL